MIVRIARFGIHMLPFLVVLLLVVELLVTNELAGFGKKVSVTDRSIDVVKEENQLLQEKVASLSSLLVIEEKSHSLGLITYPTIVTIGRDDVAFHLQP